MHDYRKLRVYNTALDVAAGCYEIARALPPSERYELARQITRSAVSVVSNIAEGAGRGDSRDFARFLRIARGSACELDAQLSIAERVGFLEPGAFMDLRDSIERTKAQLSNLEHHLTSADHSRS